MSPDFSSLWRRTASRSAIIIITIEIIVTDGLITALQRMPAIMQRGINVPGMRAERSADGIIETATNFFAVCEPAIRWMTAKTSITAPMPETAAPAQWHVPYVPSSWMPQGEKNVSAPIVRSAVRTTSAASSAIYFLFFQLSFSFRYFVIGA